MSYTFNADAKDPFDNDLHGMDFTEWLDPGETIAGVPVVEAVPSGLLVSQPNHADGVATWRIDGGVVGESYIVSVKVTTSTQRKIKRSVRYRLLER